MTMRSPRWLAVIILAGCGGNISVPASGTAMPPALAVVGDPQPPELVRIEREALPWWTLAGTARRFILGLDETAGRRSAGPRLGPIRSHDVALSPSLFSAVRCAWKIVPMGDPRPCVELRRTEAMAVSQTAIDSALADLRAQAGKAGVRVVGDVRCFAEQFPQSGDARLWCEGAALAAADEPGRPVAAFAPDAGAPIEHAPRSPATRFVLHADGSAGMLGDVPIVGATIGLRPERR